MEKILNETEVRVLGALVEKQVTTPEYYPLTLNALTLACNQKNNRNPVVSFDEATVTQAVETLRERNLVYVFYGSTSRVPKYKHMMPEVFQLDQRELALMCLLMLRGAQTPGELRGRAERLYDFKSLEEVEETLNSLMAKETEPLVIKLPRQSGQKEVRYAHLLSGEVRIDDQTAIRDTVHEAAHNHVRIDRHAKLEQEMEMLRAQVEVLRQEFEQFKKQFD